MGGKRIKKFSSGEAVKFTTRAKALKKLQLSLSEFRRLCILKGIYPVEPNNRVQASKGKTVPCTFYLQRDVRYLASDAILNKFREQKIFLKKIRKYRAKHEEAHVKQLVVNQPQISLNHLVLERYPSFVAALDDIDDALSLLSLIAQLPARRFLPTYKIQHAQQLILEFLNYVVLSKSLRKVFISIKGFYFQAEISGRLITWIMPHTLKQQIPFDIDLKIMASFLDFYTVLLGFVNFKLFSLINLSYPPEFKAAEGASLEDNLVAMHGNLVKLVDADEEVALDEFQSDNEDEAADIKALKEKQASDKRLQTLFNECVIFIGREVPRQPFVFAIKACGGKVSWESTAGPMPPFTTADSQITHQLIDRPMVPIELSQRVFVQPQWVMDCINARELLPCDSYYPGCDLPPHLSPFVSEKPGDYIPPERVAFLKRQGLDVPEEDNDESEEDEQEENREDNSESKVSVGKAVRGVKRKVNTDDLLAKQMPKKRKYYYDQIVKQQTEKKNAVKHLKNKRKFHEMNKSDKT